MEILPIDVTALVSAILGICIVLVPVVGWTARFALKPVAQVLGRFQDERSLTESIQILNRRLELQEREIEILQHSVDRLEETSDFDRQLRATAQRVELRSPEGDPETAGKSRIDAADFPPELARHREE